MRHLTLLLAAHTLACGSGASPSEPTARPSPTIDPTALSIAGSYQIGQTRIEDSCNFGTLPPVSASITHTAGTSPFSLFDSGGVTFSGNVARDGTFTSAAPTGADAQGNLFALSLAGNFTAQGFHARLTLEVTMPSGGKCREVRQWEGTKQGSSNVIPG